MTCVLCGGSRRRPLPYRYRWRDRVYGLSRCASCTLIAVDPVPGPDEIASFYDGAYFEDGFHGMRESDAGYDDVMTARADQTRRYVENDLLIHRPGAGSFFEIGAASGHVLAAARDTGVARVSGLEISPEAAAKAGELHGIDVAVGDVAGFDPGEAAGTWDLVYAGDVLEHLVDPNALLETAARLLHPDGALVVRIPTTFDLWSSRLATLMLRASGRTFDLPDAPYHLHEFTRGTATRLFARCFDDVRLLPGIVPVGDLNVKGGRLVYRIKQAVHVVNVPWTRLTGRHGDRLTIVARRPLRPSPPSR